MSNPISIWRNNKNISRSLGLTGRVIVWTKIFASPEGFESQVPYLVGIIELETLEKITAEIVDCEETDLKPNQKVITVIRRVGLAAPDGVIQYGIKVTPV